MESEDIGAGGLTAGDDYAQRLVRLQRRGWKERLRFLDPYGWQVRSMCRGRVLDVGCGIGRNLAALGPRGVGVDHNDSAVEVCRDRGLEAYTSADFAAKLSLPSFDSMLVAHVLEHVDEQTQHDIMNQYVPHLKAGARIVLICPQERGFASDETHIRWVDERTMRSLLESFGCSEIKDLSFPFPRWVGKWFIYNQFVVAGILPS